MGHSVKRKEPAAFGISARTARALADSWRVRILSELSVRPMSPSQFVEEVGGELTQIARCFRQLAEWDFVEVVETRPGRRRGAAIEHVYRGIRRSHFDTATWKTVSRSERDTWSRTAVSAYFARIAEAVQGGTFDAEVDRHVSWDGIALDRTAWLELGRRLDEVLEWLPELAVEADRRLQDPDGERIPTVAGLSAFRSPQSPTTMLLASRRHQPPPEGSSEIAFGPRMAKALSNKWRSQILFELSSRPLSPSQFVEEIGGSMTHISRCFRELAEWGLVEIIEERKGGRRGGGVERIYRGLSRPFLDTPSWESLPLIVRQEMSRSFLDAYMERVTEAIDAGTFDAEDDRHFSWKPILLDRPAWTELAQALDEVLAWLPSLESESLQRTEDQEELIPTIVGMASFRMPSQSVEA
ncbi:MAG TPA: winged helix-turn-helix domain-containing protein [Solirubrobacterales bacterium]|nr:winged helix-turn-helix domain-containing protein [Solirubrobacterales bacterium]